MPWLSIDDNFDEHKKIAPLSDAAFRLHVHGMLYSARQLTDGVIHHGILRRIGWMCNDLDATVKELIDAKLWEVGLDGYVIHDYLDYNPSAETVKSRREKNAQRQAEWRERNAVTNASTNDVSVSAPSPPLPSSPLLSPPNQQDEDDVPAERAYIQEIQLIQGVLGPSAVDEARDLLERNVPVDLIRDCRLTMQERRDKGQRIAQPWKYVMAMVRDCQANGTKPNQRATPAPEPKGFAGIRAFLEESERGN